MNPVEPFCIFASDTKYFGRYKKRLLVCSNLVFLMLIIQQAATA